MSGFASVGVVLTGAELMQDLDLPGARAVLWVGLAVGLALSIRRSLRMESDLRVFSVPLHEGGRLTVRVGDFADNVRRERGASCAFGANDEFSVRGLRPDSAHARHLATFFRGAEDAALQAHLNEAMARSDLLVPATGRTAPAHRYPYGTVVCEPFRVEGESTARNAFLVANSTRYAHGFMAAGPDSVPDPVMSVLVYHRKTNLYSETVVFSLIGTGHSRTHNPMQSIFRIIDAFMGEQRRQGTGPGPIENLVVSVPEKIVVEQGFDLEAVHLYLKARARIASHQL